MFYLELERKNWDFARLQQAWQLVLTQHKTQLTKHNLAASAFRIALVDDSSAEALRQELLSGRQGEFQEQGFVIKASKPSSETLRLYLAFSPELMNSQKFSVLWRQWQAYYQDEALQLASPSYQAMTEYWQTRLDKLAPSAAIMLPATRSTEHHKVRFKHYQAQLPANDYRRLQVLAQKHRISLTVLMLTLVQDYLAHSIGQANFRMNLILGNRLPLYPYLGDKAEYATSVAALPLLAQSGSSIVERAENIAALLRVDAKHLTTAVLPALEQVEAADTAVLPLVIECNLQQGLRQTLLSLPADIVYATEPLPIEYQLSIWEEAGEICYRCSMPQAVWEGANTQKFELHRFLFERLQAVARNEKSIEITDGGYGNLPLSSEAEYSASHSLNLHQSIVGLLNYEAALNAMQNSLAQQDTAAYREQFKTQARALDQIAGHLWSHVDQPPYVKDLTALQAGHNTLGDMFRRDAFDRAKQQLEKQLPLIENLKRIFKENPPPELFNAPEMKAVAEFNTVAANEQASLEEFKIAIKTLEKKVGA